MTGVTLIKTNKEKVIEYFSGHRIFTVSAFLTVVTNEQIKLNEKPWQGGGANADPHMLNV